MSTSPTATKREIKLPPIHPGKIPLEDMRDKGISISAALRRTRPRAWVVALEPRRSAG